MGPTLKWRHLIPIPAQLWPSKPRALLGSCGVSFPCRLVGLFFPTAIGEEGHGSIFCTVSGVPGAFLPDPGLLLTQRMRAERSGKPSAWDAEASVTSRGGVGTVGEVQSGWVWAARDIPSRVGRELIWGGAAASPETAARGMVMARQPQSCPA